MGELRKVRLGRIGEEWRTRAKDKGEWRQLVEKVVQNK